jgi:hypothetical protein
MVRNSPFFISRLIFRRTIFVPNIFERLVMDIMVDSPVINLINPFRLYIFFFVVMGAPVIFMEFLENH